MSQPAKILMVDDNPMVLFATGHLLRSEGFTVIEAKDGAECLAKARAGQPDLVLLAIDADTLGDALKWEPSRGGDLFPHLYGPLPISTTASARTLAMSEDGTSEGIRSA